MLARPSMSHSLSLFRQDHGPYIDYIVPARMSNKETNVRIGAVWDHLPEPHTLVNQIILLPHLFHGLQLTAAIATQPVTMGSIVTPCYRTDNTKEWARSLLSLCSVSVPRHIAEQLLYGAGNESWRDSWIRRMRLNEMAGSIITDNS